MLHHLGKIFSIKNTSLTISWTLTTPASQCTFHRTLHLFNISNSTADLLLMAITKPKTSIIKAITMARDHLLAARRCWYRNITLKLTICSVNNPSSSSKMAAKTASGICMVRRGPRAFRLRSTSSSFCSKVLPLLFKMADALRCQALNVAMLIIREL